eukprot:TRINITY_DN8207_c2_g1_i3.p1 TRINITY_DN8207_c2_g1~~TRINITY_DN8207_c2_g1_i3.p1  ORF type:complete len:390 (+),score=49.69 TRINITY_DN8207_c2_g1_i3:8-1177(+)
MSSSSYFSSSSSSSSSSSLSPSSSSSSSSSFSSSSFNDDTPRSTNVSEMFLRMLPVIVGNQGLLLQDANSLSQTCTRARHIVRDHSSGPYQTGHKLKRAFEEIQRVFKIDSEKCTYEDMKRLRRMVFAKQDEFLEQSASLAYKIKTKDLIYGARDRLQVLANDEYWQSAFSYDPDMAAFASGAGVVSVYKGTSFISGKFWEEFGKVSRFKRYNVEIEYNSVTFMITFMKKCVMFTGEAPLPWHRPPAVRPNRQFDRMITYLNNAPHRSEVGGEFGLEKGDPQKLFRYLGMQPSVIHICGIIYWAAQALDLTQHQFYSACEGYFGISVRPSLFYEVLTGSPVPPEWAHKYRPKDMRGVVALCSLWKGRGVHCILPLPRKNGFILPTRRDG